MKNKPTISVIVALHVEPEKNQWRIKNQRTFGYYFDHKDAVKAVKANRCDIYEEAYNYVVVEDTPEGIHPMSRESWFHWNDQFRKYIPSAKPIFFKNIVSFGIG